MSLNSGLCNSTPIGNSMYFFEKCFAITDDSTLSNYVYVIIDLDNFKMINMIFDFETGDNVLEYISDVLKNSINEYEIVERIDSDIFNMLLFKGNSPEDLHKRLEGIVEKIKSYPKIRLKPSVAVYKIGSEGENLVTIGSNAYAERKQRKANSIETITYYKNETNNLVNNQKLLLDFQDAIANHQFKVYYQVKQDLQLGRPLGAEALVRWYHPERGIIPPLEFIELFEESGDIITLDLYVFETVCRDIRRWIDTYGKAINQFKISFNLSRRTLLKDEVVDIITNIAKQYKISTRVIEIEVTESFFVSDVERVIKILAELKRKGFRISVDDFGSGYSAFNILKELKVDVLKIDREFLNSEKVDSKTKSILNSIVGLGKQLKLQITAEGVETKEQSMFLKRIGCDYAQGYYYSKPIPVSLFEEEILQKFVMNTSC